MGNIDQSGGVWTGEIRGLAFEDGIDHGPDCGDDECECWNHTHPVRREGTYITVRLDGAPRIGLSRVRIEVIPDAEAGTA